jgi:hypothetical protein
MTNYESLNRICQAYESKLKELMGESEFYAYSAELAKELFAEEICGMADSEFKDMVLDNFDAITGTDEDYLNLLGGIQDDKDYGDYDNGADY